MSADLRAPRHMSLCAKPPSPKQAQKAIPLHPHEHMSQRVEHEKLGCQQVYEPLEKSAHLSAGYSAHNTAFLYAWPASEALLGGRGGGGGEGSSPCRRGICRQLGAQGAMHGAVEDGGQAELGVDLPAQHPDLPQAHPK